MSLDRAGLVQVARILRPTKCYHHLIGILQEMIHKGPRLTVEERSLVQFAYKGLINERRASIRVITEEMNSEARAGDTVIRTKLLPLKAKLLREMKNYCSEFSALIDTKLIPNAEDVRAKIFYNKLKADAFRYMSECPDYPDRQEFILKATESYNTAMMNAQEIPKRCPLSLGLILNYAVFLFEICDKKQDAMGLLEATFSDCTKPADGEQDEGECSDSHILLQMMRDNLAIWNRAEGER